MKPSRRGGVKTWWLQSSLREVPELMDISQMTRIWKLPSRWPFGMISLNPAGLVPLVDLGLCWWVIVPQGQLFLMSFYQQQAAGGGGDLFVLLGCISSIWSHSFRVMLLLIIGFGLALQLCCPAALGAVPCSRHCPHCQHCLLTRTLTLI